MAGVVTSQPVVPAVVRTGWITRQRLLLLALGGLIVAAAALRLLTFERYLPYIDNPDESYMYLLARAWRGVEEVAFIPERLAGYPPFYVWFQMGVQQAFETLSPRPWYLPVDYLYLLRLIAVFVGTATTVCMIALGWQLGGGIAAWLAGAAWALAPIMMLNNSFAIADPFVYLGVAASAAMAIRAWQKESLRWLFGSLLMAILAIYAKYWALHVLIPWGFAAIRLAKRRKYWPWLALQALVGLIAAAALLAYVLNSGLSRLSPEMTAFADEGAASAFDLARNLNNWKYVPAPLGVGEIGDLSTGTILFWAALLAALPAYGYSRRRGWRIVDWRWFAILGLAGVVGVMLISSFININSLKFFRHTIIVLIMFLGLWGAALAQITWTLAELAKRLPKRPIWRALPLVPAALVTAATLPAYVIEDVRSIQQFEQIPTAVVLWKWADVNVPMDGMLLSHPKDPTGAIWNRPWSGYDGSKPFTWWHETEDQIAASTPARYVERGITYFVMSDLDIQRSLFHTDAVKAFIDQLTLVKTIPTGGNLTGPTYYFYRMLPPQHETQVTFGEQIVLAGYDLNGSVFAPGNNLRFRPYWRIVRRPDTNYSLFVHLYPDGADQFITQHDGPPTTIHRPTLTWDDTGELYIGAEVLLTIPPETPAGDYQLMIGVYDYSNGQRLPTEQGSDAYPIPITIR